MKHAMKLALIDPKHLGSADPKHSEYKELNKNPQGVAQAGASINLREILVDPSIPDDIKVKLYSQALDRFLKLGNAIDPDDSKPVVVNHEQQPVKLQTRDDNQSKKKKKRKKEDSTLSFKTPSPSLSSTPKTKVRKSSRPKKQRQLSPGWVAW
jgi:hypothetical protein